MISKRRFAGFCTVATAVGWFAAACGDNPTTPRRATTPSTQPLFATATTLDCMEDDAKTFGEIKSNQSLNCTANDIKVANAGIKSVKVNGVPAPDLNNITCSPNDKLEITMDISIVQSSSSERQDMGLWIHTDTVPPSPTTAQMLTGDCDAFHLPSTGNGITNTDGDQCGGVAAQAVSPGITPLNSSSTGATITALCQDLDSDGKVDLAACSAWKTPNDDQTCADPGQSTAEAGFRKATLPIEPSKCECNPIALPITINLKGSITVVKACDPTTDDGTFDLNVDGAVKKDDATCTPGTSGTDNTTGTVEVSAGTSANPGANHTVSETGFKFPGEYNSSYSCTSDQNHSLSGTGTSIDPVHVDPDEDWTCTFTNVRKGSIEIVKDAVPDDAQDFHYITTGTGLANFDLDDDSDATLKNAQKFLLLDPGTYTVAEDAVTGWDLTDLTCSDANSTRDLTTRTATIKLEAGEAVKCTFTNTKRGNITVKKVTDPTGLGDSFGFAAGTGLSPSSFSLKDGGKQDFLNLKPGTYTTTETVPTGFDLTSISCDDGSSAGKSSGDTGTGVATFRLDPGETVTCTYTNTQKRGKIVVKKVTDPSPNTSDAFSFSASGSPTTLSPASFSLKDGGEQSFTPVLAGTYTVTETVPTGFDLTDLTCVEDGTKNSTTDLATGKASITVDPAETVTCTYTNTQRGNIKVKKVTDPTGLTTSFGFAAGTGLSPSSFSLQDGGTRDFLNLKPGTYTTTETVATGFDLTSISCDDGSSAGKSSGDTGTGVATFKLDPGETVTCTYTNTQKRGTILIDKVTVPSPNSTDAFSFSASGSPSTLSNFTLKDTDNPKSFSPVLAGTYTVTESALTGFDLTDLTCDDGSSATPSTVDKTTGAATIKVDPGETVKCTFTNTQRGKVIIKKVTDPTGLTTSFSFTNGVDGTGNFSLSDGQSKTLGPVKPGAYSVTETLTSDFVLQSIACDDANSTGDTGTGKAAINVEAGETVTCTYTNAPAGRGQIAPTQTTCEDFASQNSQTLDKLFAQVSTKGNPANRFVINVSPGVFFYFAEATKATSAEALGFTQTVVPGTKTLNKYTIQQTQASIYTYDGSSCTKVGDLTDSGTSGTGGVGLKAGKYIIQVKFTTDAQDNFVVGTGTVGEVLSTHLFQLLTGGSKASVQTVRKN